MIALIKLFLAYLFGKRSGEAEQAATDAKATQNEADHIGDEIAAVKRAPIDVADDLRSGHFGGS